MTHSPTWTKGGAEFSDCKRFRYLLWRELNPSLLTPQERSQVLWVMLNPSTATETKDDPTIRRCIAFSSAWRFRRVVICNLWAFRATKPLDLVAQVLEHGSEAAAGGTRNDEALRAQAALSGLIVAAWGAHVTGRALKPTGQPERITAMLQAASELRCLGLTAEKYPKHPLYVSSAAVLQPYPPA